MQIGLTSSRQDTTLIVNFIITIQIWLIKNYSKMHYAIETKYIFKHCLSNDDGVIFIVKCTEIWFYSGPRGNMYE